MSRRLPRVYHAAGFPWGSAHARRLEVRVARIELWNGDICDLEVDAIVSPAATSLWMSTGVAGELKRAGGDEIEFAAVRQAPVELGDAIVTAGRPARRQGRHPRRVPRARPPHQRRRHRPRRPERDGPRPRARACRASRSRPWARASAGSRSTRPPGSPCTAVRDELHTPPLGRARHLRAPRRGRVRRLRRGPVGRRARAGPPARRAGLAVRRPGPPDAARRDVAGTDDGARVSFPMEPLDQRREALVEAVAREIRLRGLTGPAVHFLEASRPVPAAGRARDAVLRPGPAATCSAADSPSATELLADDAGIEALIDRLEELDEVDGWDA